jgi:catechol 2,3-dioxygenase-like lactoylglutathione lyase family enzyme
MALDHLSFGTTDMRATRAFYEGALGFPVVIHERMMVAEGGQVDHVFFDCGGGSCIAFMQWVDVPGVPARYEAGINRGLGVPPGTFHFAFRCESLAALEARRTELAGRGVKVGQLLDLPPYKSFFFDDPNGLRLEYTTRVGTLSAADRDPSQRCFPVSLSLFTDL